MTDNHQVLSRAESSPAGPILEIACDESGSEGEKLIGGNTDVFAHAGIRLSAEVAAECIQEIRGRIRSPATEYKANHLLREKHRPVLKWLLGPSSPIHGNAHVYLADKAFFAVGRVIDLLVGEISYTAGAGSYQDQRSKDMAVTLYREGQRAFGRDRWNAFLESFNDLMRARIPVDSFFHMVDALRLTGTPGEVDEILRLLGRARPHADSFLARLLENPKTIPVLDPLIPAIVQAVVHWSEGGTPVSIVHDEHYALTQERVARLKEMVETPHPTVLRYSPRGRLTSLRLVDSRSDPRVQVADFLAGVARKIASDELNARGDAELVALLRPYVDASSIWGDDRSWSLLGPAPVTRSPGPGA
ncbi:hypothetical protein GCM10022226_13620 [Sphaerisporangium flaviroseum]|uniref:DUF3800 domain-containing protein n=1 Tax=Sphaerisporangium flaviroseum TaxID=509199 RepID=A0ABP7HI81_9ACTN